MDRIHSFIHLLRTETANLTFTQVLTLETVLSFGVSHSWIGVPALTLTTNKTLGKLFNLPESQFLHL